jgi:hypothetical protein
LKRRQGDVSQTVQILCDLNHVYDWGNAKGLEVLASCVPLNPGTLGEASAKARLWQVVTG